MKPEFFTDKKMGDLGPTGAVVYQALWVAADDGGMAQCDPELLKSTLFFRWSAVGVREITDALRHLFEMGRIRFFRGGDDLFCQIRMWKGNQPIHKPSKFRFREDYAKKGKELEETVPEWCGVGVGGVVDSPYPLIPKSLNPGIPESPNPQIPVAVAREKSEQPEPAPATDVPPQPPLPGHAVKAIELLRGKLPPEAHGPVDHLLRKVRSPYGWATDLLAHLNGLNIPTVTPEQMARALLDADRNGDLENPNIRQMRRYLQGALREESESVEAATGERWSQEAAREREARVKNA